MAELVLLGIDAATVAAAASLATVGLAGLFSGGDDGGDLSGIARRLDAPEDPIQIERTLDDLDDAIDTLAGDADLERHLRDPPAPDASSVEKAKTLERAVEAGQLSIGPTSASGRSSGDDGTVSSAAAHLRRDLSPSSPAARQLLDRVASPERAAPDEVADALERAVTALDTQQALERALAEVDEDGLAQGDARRVRDRLGHPDNEATAGVRRLARAAESYHETAERQETEQQSVASATDALTAAAADAADLDVAPDSGRSVAERLRVLADAVERDELGFADGGDAGQVTSVAGEVRRSKHPESAVAKRLLDRLASPGMGDLRAALDTAVEQLDTASTTQSVVADVDRESVRDLADDVASQLESTAGPAAEALAERVAELQGMVDRADESNAVIPYAVRHELRFYDQTLLSHVGSAGRSTGRPTQDGDAEADLAAVNDRRESVEERHVNGRRDHNHSIPLHFLSLVDALAEDAEQAVSVGDDGRAAGLCSAADETLDYVEQLYERNEYSVMLRRLRG